MQRFLRGKTATFLVALAIYLILRALSGLGPYSLTQVTLYLAIALSLLASNVPRIMDIPLHYVYPIRIVELFSFAVSIACFALLFVRRFLGA